jgi:cytoskeletal protein CcmA (bactofilin family)
MTDYRMEGICKINGGEFGTMTVDGIGTCTGDLKVESICINGVFKCQGAVEAGTLKSDGTADFDSSIRAGKIHVDGVLNVKGDTKIEAEEVVCNGVIRAEEICADIVRADGAINAREITGDRIRINSCAPLIARFFMRKFSHIDLIEATQVELTGVIAKSVNGKDIRIGPNCEIENLDCNGTLFIDRKSSVKNITGNYTMQ